MLRVGHYGAAMLACLPVLTMVGPDHQLLAIGLLVGSLIGARLPDIDQQIPFVPHRGPTHTVWFAALIGLSGTGLIHSIFPATAGQVLVVLGGGPALGILSHLAADGITPAGIRPLWPLSGHLFSLDLVRAENALANRGLFLLGMLGILADRSVVVLGGG